MIKIILASLAFVFVLPAKAQTRRSVEEIMAHVEMTRKQIATAPKGDRKRIAEALRVELNKEAKAGATSMDEAFKVASDYKSLAYSLISSSCDESRYSVKLSQLDPHGVNNEKAVVAERRRIQYQLQFIDAYCK